MARQKVFDAAAARGALYSRRAPAAASSSAGETSPASRSTMTRLVSDASAVAAGTVAIAGGAWSEEFGRVARPDGRVVLGATRATGSGLVSRSTTAGVREVLDEALQVAPGPARAEVREIQVWLRPLAPNALPVLGPVPSVRGVVLVTGHGSTGPTLGGYCGKVMADQMLGARTGTDVGPFSVGRFGQDTTAHRAGPRRRQVGSPGRTPGVPDTGIEE